MERAQETRTRGTKFHPLLLQPAIPTCSSLRMETLRLANKSLYGVCSVDVVGESIRFNSKYCFRMDLSILCTNPDLEGKPCHSTAVRSRRFPRKLLVLLAPLFPKAIAL